MADECTFWIIIGVGITILTAGNVASGHVFTNVPEEQLKECLTTVETVQQYLKKDSVQKVAFTTLKEACQHVLSSDMKCDHMVKAVLPRFNSFALTKLQPKNVCFANFTVQGLDKEGGIIGLLCPYIVNFLKDALGDWKGTIVSNVANSVCSIFPFMKNVQEQCVKFMEQGTAGAFDMILKELTPEKVCGKGY